MSDEKQREADGVDPLATGLGEPPKDTAGVTGGEYADADANPAFHGEEVPGNKDVPGEGAEQNAYEEDGQPTR